MNTSMDMNKVNGHVCAAVVTQERHESQVELKGFRLSVPTPLGEVKLEIDEYSAGSLDKESGLGQYHHNGEVHKDVEPSPATVTEGYKFAGLIVTTLSGQIVAMQSADIAARAAREHQEQVMAEMRHLHQLELMKLTDELEAARHARIQASKHAG